MKKANTFICRPFQEHHVNSKHPLGISFFGFELKNKPILNHFYQMYKMFLQ